MLTTASFDEDKISRPIYEIYIFVYEYWLECNILIVHNDSCLA